MAGKPSIQWYPGDWFKAEEVRACSPSTRGIWVDLINYAFTRDSYGAIDGTVESLARRCGATFVEMETAVNELEQTKAADVIRNGNGSVTLVCRRLKKEQEERDATRERVRKHRAASGSKDQKQESNPEETKMFSRTRTEEEVEDEEEDRRGEEVKEKENGSPRENGFTSREPPSLDEIKTYFAEKNAPLVEAEKFFNYFTANGWRISGRAPMRSWRHAASNWILSIGQFGRSPVQVPARASPPTKPDPPPRSFSAEYMEVEAENFALKKGHFRKHDTNQGERWTLTQEGEKAKRQAINRRQSP